MSQEWTNPMLKETESLKEENKKINDDIITAIGKMEELYEKYNGVERKLEEIAVNLQNNKIAEVPKDVKEQITSIDELVANDPVFPVEEMMNNSSTESKNYTIINLPGNIIANVDANNQQARTTMLNSKEIFNLSKSDTQNVMKM